MLKQRGEIQEAPDGLDLLDSRTLIVKFLHKIADLHWLYAVPEQRKPAGSHLENLQELSTNHLQGKQPSVLVHSSLISLSSNTDPLAGIHSPP